MIPSVNGTKTKRQQWKKPSSSVALNRDPDGRTWILRRVITDYKEYTDGAVDGLRSFCIWPEKTTKKAARQEQQQKFDKKLSAEDVKEETF